VNLYHMNDGTLLVTEPLPQQGFDPLRIKHGIAGVVRWWGTTRGRGELAISGPTDNTKCDVEPSGEIVLLHVRRIITVLPHARARWIHLLESLLASGRTGSQMPEETDD
jgi:hypothetical protein